jgi:hypothetical protein
MRHSGATYRAKLVVMHHGCSTWWRQVDSSGHVRRSPLNGFILDEQRRVCSGILEQVFNNRAER